MTKNDGRAEFRPLSDKMICDLILLLVEAIAAVNLNRDHLDEYVMNCQFPGWFVITCNVAMWDGCVTVLG